MLRAIAVLILTLAFGFHLSAGETPAPEGAVAYIMASTEGATVTRPVTVQFGLKNMGVAPAGLERYRSRVKP